MGTIISHSTARAVWRLASKRPADGTPPSRADLLAATPSVAEATDLRHHLELYGLVDDATPLEVLLLSTSKAGRNPAGTVVHTTRISFPTDSFISIEGGNYLVSIELCALQAATYLTFPELVEYYYELCGAYTLYDDSNEYRERRPLTSTSRLYTFFTASKGAHGVKLACRALKYVRDRCRSPLEAAFAIMLTMPKANGGLGIRKIEADYRVELHESAKALARRRWLYLDLFLPRSKTDVEYNGFYHDENEIQAIDEERRNALASMGYNVIYINRQIFFDRMAFRRSITAIMRWEGICPSHLPLAFQIDQEELRRFVLRRYLLPNRGSSTTGYHEDEWYPC